MAIGINMQQLNILPIKVSQNVETKDDSAVFNSSTSHEGFSQQIDLHLAKNNGDTKEKAKLSEINSMSKNDIDTTEKNKDELDTVSIENSEVSHGLDHDSQSASNDSNIAATGKNIETEAKNSKSAESNDTVDEPALLLSFLIKADKTLIKDNTIASLHGAEIPEEQKAKYEDLLHLKQNEIKSSTSLKKATNLSSQLDNNTTDKSVDHRIKGTENIAAIDGESKHKEVVFDKSSSSTQNISEDGNLVKKLNRDQQLPSTELKEIVLVENVEKNKQTAESFENKGALLKNENETKLSTLGSSLRDKSINAQNELLLHKNNELNKTSLSVESLSKNTEVRDQTTTGENELEIKSLLNEQKINSEQSSNKNNKREIDVNSSIVSKQNNNAIENSNKSSQVVKESNVELNADSIDAIVEQRKDVIKSLNNGDNSKMQLHVKADTIIPSYDQDSLIRETQKAYERVAQQSPDLLNPLASSDVSQSQKTNIQLHHETISIFRKDFSEAVKDKVMLVISQKLQQFDISLDPPELGNMQVRVNLQGEQATVNFVVQNQQAKDALEQNMQKLKDLLADQGVDVGDANVEQQSKQSNQSDDENSASDNRNNFVANTAEADEVIELSLSSHLVDTSTKAIDYYA